MCSDGGVERLVDPPSGIVGSWVIVHFLIAGVLGVETEVVRRIGDHQIEHLILRNGLEIVALIVGDRQIILLLGPGDPGRDRRVLVRQDELTHQAGAQ